MGGDDGTGFGGDFGATFGDFGGMTADGGFADGFGPAGPGPAEGSETGESDYGGGLFGGMEGVTSGMSDLGSVLANMSQMTDLSDLSSLFADLDTSNMNFAVSQNMPDAVAAQETDWGKYGKVAAQLSAVLNSLGRGNLATSMLGSAPMSMALSSNPAASWGKGAITTGLGMAFGPAGAALGSLANSFGLTDAFTGALGQVNNGGVTGAAESQTGEGSMMDALPGLMGMYANYQGQKQSGDMLGGLQGLYSQNSPYSQMLQQSLQRRDAAAGRRSQYGGRDVELQAKLAQMASSQIPAMSQIANNRTMQRNQMLQQGLGAFQKMGGLQSLMGMFQPGLWEQSIARGLPSMPNNFDIGLDSLFGNVPSGGGFNFDLPDWGG
jgi:hypothetical protein